MIGSHCYDPFGLKSGEVGLEWIHKVIIYIYIRGRGRRTAMGFMLRIQCFGEAINGCCKFRCEQLWTVVTGDQGEGREETVAEHFGLNNYRAENIK